MTQQEQIRFVTKLTTAITNELLADIRSGRVPEGWNGMELRQLMADRYARAVFKDTFTRSRKKAYNNAVIVNSL